RPLVCGAAVLDEIRTLVEVLVDGDAELLWRHVGELFAGALGDLFVESRLKRRQADIARIRKGDRERAAPTNDVAGDQHSRADGVAAANLIADPNERSKLAVAVANGRHAVFQMKLR